MQPDTAPQPAPSPGGGLPVLWLCGAPGSGKSVTAWALYRSRGEQVAYVDIDQLKMLYPADDDRASLGAAALAELVALHRRLGTRALIVSGVLDVGQRPLVEAALGDAATLTWCLVDADDAALTARIEARGWPAELVAQVLAEAAQLRDEHVGPRLDTSATSVAEVAAQAGELLRLRPAVASEPSPGIGDCADLVVVFGPRAVGKSTLSWALFEAAVGRGEPTAYLDADQLGFVHADAARRDALVAGAVAALAGTFREAGARRTLANGNLGPAELAALAAIGATLIGLDALDAVLRERIAARGAGDAARLAGDDLTGATPAARAAVLARARAQRTAYDAAGLPELRVEVGSADVAANVAAVERALPSTAAGLAAPID